MPFKDRSDAGRKLAKALAAYRDQDPVILALPRGGVPVAAEVTAVLHAPLDLILVRKIGLPIQPELAMGALSMAARRSHSAASIRDPTGKFRSDRTRGERCAICSWRSDGIDLDQGFMP